MVLLLLVDIIRYRFCISPTSLGCGIIPIPDNENADEIPLVGTFTKRQPTIAGKCLTFEPAHGSRSAECVGICARGHHRERYVNILRQSLHSAFEGILIVRSCELVEADVQVAPVVGDYGLRV